MMRRTVAIETSLAVLLAFFFAPFQHVHTGQDSDHAHSGEIHAHFFFPHVVPHVVEHATTGGVHIEADDDDDHAHARSVNAFTLVLPNSLALCLPGRAPAIAVVNPETVAPVATVEERAHAPPCLDNSTPRGPPL